MQPRFALVTGANRGLGFAYADVLLEKGYSVVVTARNVDAGHRAVSRLKMGHPSRAVIFVPLDVTKQESIDALCWCLRDRSILLEVLINNAAVCPEPWSSEVCLDEGEIRVVFSTNFYGPITLLRELDSNSLISPTAHILNVSSGDAELVFFTDDWVQKLQSVKESGLDSMGREAAEHLGCKGAGGLLLFGAQPVYRVSKALLNAATRVMGVSMAKSESGVRINASCPGDVETRLASPGVPLLTTHEAAKLSLSVLNDRRSGKFFRGGTEIPW